MTITRTQRVTAQLSPTIRFYFSDGSTIETKSNGYGCEYESNEKQLLISKWFNLI